MATESVAIPPEMYGAPAVKGNFTNEAAIHLWCARALACVVSSQEAMEIWNNDIQDALRYLLEREVSRAAKAHEAESGERFAAINSLPRV